MPLLNKSEYARHRKANNLPGGSSVAVGYAVREGRITCVDGKIDPEVADSEWASNTSPAACASGVRGGAGRTAQRVEERLLGRTPKPPKSDRTDFNKSRASKEFYESELSRLKFEEKAGTLIPSPIVRKVLYEAGRIIRAGHEDIVAQLAPDLASETKIISVERILKKALDALDNALSDRIEHLEDSLLASEKKTEEDDEDEDESEVEPDEEE